MWDVASRISHQIRVCEWRFRQLSEAYHDQLIAVIQSKRFKERNGVVDGFTWLGYLAFQAFVVDACVLRDYFAEYRALILPPESQLPVKVRRLKSLKQYYLDKIEPEAEADKLLASATVQGGWLFVLSAYRNLVVHYAPIASAGKDLFAYCVRGRLANGGELPSIKLPIPQDPDDIIVKRSSGSHLEDPSLDYARFINALKDPESVPDGLDYAFSLIAELALLGLRLSEISPVAPQMRKFDVTGDGDIS